MSIFVALAILELLILAHELGHFIAARAFGVRVETFSIGFGPKVLKFRCCDTEFAVSLIPLGGYVKTANESPDTPPWQRIVIALAGPLMNLLLAVICFTAVYLSGVVIPDSKVVKVLPGSPAYEAGIKSGDRILKVNGEPFRWSLFEKAVESGKEVKLTILRDGKGLSVTLKPVFMEKFHRRISGVFLNYRKVSYPLPEALKKGLQEYAKLSALFFKTLYKLATGKVSLRSIGGPILSTQELQRAVHQGITALLLYAGFISLQLGYFNLLPLPVLDGGAILLHLAEALRGGRPVPAVARAVFNLIGLALLAAVVLIGLANDLKRLL
ncbi:membrane-associated zinc metalloprotease (plasmid) [Thermovibrio ammonificans HB-1]|uniref:Membrane-associated zinc metalloprotease n=1 Tax=Thermovibrio ammonificans (strain DSM 15698 / JCM 12110 / HB-1) TaxID=648996 RepID=E8T6Z7_THEA1|nr:M50 family metallopeptidase [Thermovibrio ammonificans]ADU97718.1 membrane-associated zinc metalloprotease [Thermovibrio ammonificans HB-1]